MEEKIHLPPPNPSPPSPELARGLPKHVVNELLHHLVHLFLAGDQGEGHPQASSSSSPSTSRMNSAQSTPTPPYANTRPLAHALLVAATKPIHDFITIDDLGLQRSHACQIYHPKQVLYILTNL
uniref:Uncharacterized protein n=1 Tax=Setaria viridis TaxID=4556 RepID=A0A4U6URW2_SETVI|nr:hypothetical protein SEVIR_5G430900v2 [Setaria viridis]